MGGSHHPGMAGFNGEASYRIIVQGGVPVTWQDRLAGMTISSVPGEASIPVCTLEGVLRDQAELNGVLASLYCLNTTILSVERLKEGPEDTEVSH